MKANYRADYPCSYRYDESEESVNKMYCTARLDATKETQIEMPKDCPYSIGDVLTKVIAGEYQSKRQRVLDLNKGEIWMSDDFNAPLSDEFWLGKE